MTTYNKVFPKMEYVGYTSAFPIGDANDHTFVAVVANKKTSVDYNFQITLDGTNWADLGSDIQKTANGVYITRFEGYHGMAVRGAYKAEVGGTKATATVGTVVILAVNKGATMNGYTVETATGVAQGAETAEISGTAILITGHVDSKLGQVQAAIAANAEVAALITATGITTFAADGPTALATGDGAEVTITYKGGE